VTSGKPIAVLLQSISGVSAINPLVAFYDIHGGKREVLFFYFVPDTTRDQNCNQKPFIRHRHLHTLIERQNLYYPLQNYREAWNENNGSNKLIQIYPPFTI
jgi:hypothetical protein